MTKWTWARFPNNKWKCLMKVRFWNPTSVNPWVEITDIKKLIKMRAECLSFLESCRSLVAGLTSFVLVNNSRWCPTLLHGFAFPACQPASIQFGYLVRIWVRPVPFRSSGRVVAHPPMHLRHLSQMTTVSRCPSGGCTVPSVSAHEYKFKHYLSSTGYSSRSGMRSQTVTVYICLHL